MVEIGTVPVFITLPVISWLKDEEVWMARGDVRVRVDRILSYQEYRINGPAQKRVTSFPVSKVMIAEGVVGEEDVRREEDGDPRRRSGNRLMTVRMPVETLDKMLLPINIYG